MKKSEIKKASNQSLIEYLISTAFLSKISKSKVDIAFCVCNELEKRGIIENPQSLFKLWNG